MTHTYEYVTKGNTNVEVFDSKGYVTLHRNGKFVYEHQFSTLGVKIQEMELLNQFMKWGVEYKLTKSE